jgi:hypothetical protein
VTAPVGTRPASFPVTVAVPVSAEPSKMLVVSGLVMVVEVAGFTSTHPSMLVSELDL